MQEGASPNERDIGFEGASSGVHEALANSTRELAAHDVKPGDTFYSIARQYQMEGGIQAVADLNPDKDARSLLPGDRLVVYRLVEPSEEILAAQPYYVERGDTLSGIAQEHGLELQEVLRLNPNIEPNRLRVRQVINLPPDSTSTILGSLNEPVSRERSSTPARAGLTVDEALERLENYKQEIERANRTFVMSERSRNTAGAWEALHVLLREAGCVGEFGGEVPTEATFRAIRDLQAAHGLVQDRKFGSRTFETLKLALSSEISTEQYVEAGTRSFEDSLQSVRDGEVVLSAGTAADTVEQVTMVRELQNLLNEAGAWPALEETGVYNALTERAVRNFQRSQELSVDGRVGKNTMQALDESRAKFLFALERVLGEEGGVSNHRNDRGGLTNYGVTQGTYNAWRDKHHLRRQPVTEIRPGEVRAVYRQDYWQAAYCDRYSLKIAAVVFDCAVNCGPGTARRHLNQAKESLNLDTDDLRDPSAAVEKLVGLELIRLRQAHHDRIVERDQSQKVFQRGWNNRINRLEQMIVEN